MSRPVLQRDQPPTGRRPKPTFGFLSKLDGYSQLAAARPLKVVNGRFRHMRGTAPAPFMLVVLWKSGCSGAVKITGRRPTKLAGYIRCLGKLAIIGTILP